MLGREISYLLEEVRKRRPLIHHITNYVTVNDCANMAICIGAAPVMADAIEEMDDMVALAGALVLNIGTLNERLVESMICAGRRANELKIPVLLDPVGAGATSYRTKTAIKLLDSLEIAVLKGNAGEIATLAGAEASVVGVDSRAVSGDPVSICSSYAERMGITVAMTGPQDVVSDGRSTYIVENGHEYMERVSGTGCMASTACAAFVSVSDDFPLACASALSVFCLAGEKAAKEANGPMSFRTKMFDAIYNLDRDQVISEARIREL